MITSFDLLATFLANAVKESWPSLVPGHSTASCQLVAHQDTQALLLQSCFLVFPKPVLLHGDIPFQMQELACAFIELSEDLLNPFLQSVQDPLNGNPAL